MRPTLPITNGADHDVRHAERASERDGRFSLRASVADFAHLIGSKLGAGIPFSLKAFGMLMEEGLCAAFHLFRVFPCPMLITTWTAFQSTAKPSLLFAVVDARRRESFGVLTAFFLIPLIVFSCFLGSMGATGRRGSADTTMPVSLGVSIGVLLIIRMPLRAMCFT